MLLVACAFHSLTVVRTHQRQVLPPYQMPPEESVGQCWQVVYWILYMGVLLPTLLLASKYTACVIVCI